MQPQQEVCAISGCATEAALKMRAQKVWREIEVDYFRQLVRSLVRRCPDSTLRKPTVLNVNLLPSLQLSQ